MADNATSEDNVFEGSNSTIEQPEKQVSSADQSVEQSETQETNNQTETTPSESNVGESDGVQAEDAEIIDFLAKKGLNVEQLDNPKEAMLKLGKMALNSERGYKNGTQEIAELRRQLAEINAYNANQNQNAIEESNAQFLNEVQTWSQNKNLSESQEAVLVEWLKQPVGGFLPDGMPVMRIHLVANGALKLDDAYKAAGLDEIKASELRASMRAEVEKELIAKQTAKRPSGNATNSMQFAKPSDETDLFLDGFNS